MVGEVWFTIEDICLFEVVSLSVLPGFIQGRGLFEDRITEVIFYELIVINFEKIIVIHGLH